jgi:hypothetical protein
MTAAPRTPAPQPAHPLPAMTTYELRDYRRELETALAASDTPEPARSGLHDRLAAVLAEQDDRARLAASSGGHCRG